jgi:hypothetical protein
VRADCLGGNSPSQVHDILLRVEHRLNRMFTMNDGQRSETTNRERSVQHEPNVQGFCLFHFNRSL